MGEKQVTAYVDDMRLDVAVRITSANTSADVSFNVTSLIVNSGDPIMYGLSIRNTKPSENVYKLAVTGLPDNWYYRYKETQGSTQEMAEAVIPASSSKNLVLEVVPPPHSVAMGDYNFTAVVTTPMVWPSARTSRSL